MNHLPHPLKTALAGFGAAIVILATTIGVTAETASLFTGFQSQSDDPIQIDAATLEITEANDQRISVFSGNVVVRRGDTTLRAKTIHLYSDLDDDRPKGQAFSRIEAKGNVEVTSDSQKVTGSKVVVDMGKQTITMSGNVVLSQGANVITGERLVIDLASGRARVEQTAGKRIRGVFAPGSGGLVPPGQ